MFPDHGFYCLQKQPQKRFWRIRLASASEFPRTTKNERVSHASHNQPSR
jgi:hypothetical protein